MEGASCFVNPLTVLGQVGTMRRDGHTALVHTAAASNLGQMLNRLCLADGIALVNIVRSSEQEQLRRSAGATYVCNSTAVSFTDDLTAALTATGATIAFDAIGGGRLAGQILSCMEAALVASAAEYSRYGSATDKHVYIYGGLDRGPTELNRNVGMAWSVGGWLLTPYLAKVGPEEVQRMRQRVAAEITTTFASTYTRQISLVEALSPRTPRRLRKPGHRREVPRHTERLTHRRRDHDDGAMSAGVRDDPRRPREDRVVGCYSDTTRLPHPAQQRRERTTTATSTDAPAEHQPSGERDLPVDVASDSEQQQARPASATTKDTSLAMHPPS